MIVELSTFRLRPGTEEAAFLAAAEETQTQVLAPQAGFLGRELLQGPDGSWTDMVRFADEDSARAAVESFMANPAARMFESMLDPDTVSMSHWSLVRSW